MLPLLSHWMTPHEQGLLMSLSFAGVGIGNAATYPISGFLCKYGGWKLIFYCPGAICFVWLLLAYFFLQDKPVTHPRISVEEKQFLTSQVTRKESKVLRCHVTSITKSPLWDLQHHYVNNAIRHELGQKGNTLVENSNIRPCLVGCGDQLCRLRRHEGSVG